MEYLKIAPDIDSDPDLMEAGWCATRVFELLLKVSAAKDLRGRIPEKFRRPKWLLDFWKAKAEPGFEPSTVLDHGLRQLVAVGQVKMDGEHMVVGGWEKFYNQSISGSARTRAWRERQLVRPPVTCDDGDARDDGDEHPSRGDDEKTAVTPVTTVTNSRHCDATPLHTTPPTPLHVDSSAPPAPATRPPTPKVVAPVAKAEKPTLEREKWTFQEFQQWVQYIRQNAGHVPEEPVPIFEGERWWGVVMNWTEGEVPPVCQGFIAFGQDEYWEKRKPPFPLKGFMSQWTKYMPAKEAKHARG